MKIHNAPHKIFWLLLAVFLLFLQPAFATELTEDELLAMPAVSITYTLAENTDPLTVDAVPTLSPLGKAYWATLPPEAFSFPMTLSITASETALYTFDPPTGTVLTSDPTTMDYNGLFTPIYAYQNDQLADTYNLYLSTAEVPLPVQPAEVPVYYVDSEDNSNVLYYEVITAYYGEPNTVTVDPSRVPANYTLISDPSASVTVNDQGQASPEWVTFYFQQQILQGTLHIYYTDARGNEVASSQTETLSPGTHTVTPAPTDLEAGYVLSADSPAQEDVQVDDLGNVSPAAVTFIYESAVVTGYVTVNYTDDKGAQLADSEVLEFETGDHTVTPNPALIPAGYVLISQEAVPVTVDSIGGVIPTFVNFTYQAVSTTPAQGNLKIYYAKADGSQLIPVETRTLPQGEHVITPNAAVIPSGYTLSPASPAEQTVSVGADGVVTPLSVTFVYDEVQQQPATGTLTVEYIDVNGAQITSRTVSVPQGTSIISLDAATLPAGYTLAEGTPSEYSVTVDASGAVSPASVQFTLTAVSGEGYTLIPVERYATTNTSAVNLRSTPDSTPTTNIAFPSVNQGTRVWVYGTFTLDGREWASISYSNTDCYVWNEFLTLESDAAPASGTLTVRYLDLNDQPITDNETYTLEEGSHTVIPGTAPVPGGYVLSPAKPAQFTVTVDANGVVTPSTVTFYYEQEASSTDPTQYPGYTAVGANAVTNDTGVRFRSVPSTASLDTILYQVNQGTQVWVNGTFTLDGREWASIRYNETDCFVWNEFLTLQSAAPATGTLTVRYRTADDAVVADDQTVTLEAGTHTVTPTAAIPSGYTLAGGSAAQYTVTVDDTGAVTPAAVTFTYATAALDPTAYPDYTAVGANAVTNDTGVRFRSVPSTASLDTVLYQVTQGTEVFVYGTFTVDGAQWAYIRYADTDCYVLYSLLTLQSAAPQSGVLTVKYQLADGTPVADDQTVTLSEGTYSVSPDPAHISDTYTLADGTPGQFSVTVDGSGNLSLNPVVFTYVAADQPVTGGTLTVRYRLADGTAIAEDQSVPLLAGTHPIAPDPAIVPAGYVPAPDAPAEVSVTVDETGVTPNPVTFTYVLQASETTPADHKDISGDYADYTMIGVSGVTNDTGVRLRSTPTSASITNILYQVPKGTVVWVYGTFTKDGTLWAYTSYNGDDCYVWYSLLDVDEASIPVRATLTVKYQRADGTPVADDQSVVLEAGTHTVSPDAAHVPAEYFLSASSAAQYSVTVGADGSLDQNPVIFVYEKSPASGSLTVQYRLADGTEVVADQTVTLSQGTHTVSPNPALITSEYALSGAAETQVTVDENGAVSPNPVTFFYTLDTAAAPPADISGTYADYTAIGVSAETNDTAVNLRSTPNSSITTNIVSKVPLGTPVWVHGSFTVGDRMWAYVRYADVDCYVWYSLLTLHAPETPATGTLTVRYRLADGTELIDDQALTYEPGTYTVTPDAALVPAGYVLAAASPSAVDITVASSGSITPDTVTFLYERQIINGTLTVHYRQADGTPVADDQSVTLGEGTHTVTPDGSLIPSGFKLTASSATQYSVMVDSAGTVSPASVTFVYEREVVSGTLRIRYLVGDADVVTPLTRTLGPGTYPITLDESLIPTGYQLTDSSPTSYTVTVSAAGVVSPDTVIFPLKAVETELEMYVGYAVTIAQVALRNDANFDDSAILTTLPADTLLYLNGQVSNNGAIWTGAQTYLGTSYIGLLPFAAVKTITPGQAQVYIDAYKAAHASPSPSPSPSPAPSTGYYLTLGDDVPLRNVPGTSAGVSAWIAEDQVVYVNGQVFYDNYTWNVSYYGALTGYIRSDQVRPMTAAEVDAYLSTVSPTATPAQTAAPYDPNAASSYGYVTANSVNFRQTPNGTRIGVLNKYAFALILGTRDVNGTTWYNINQSGTEGWVSGGYFNVLSLSALTTFLNSSDYLQGIMNNGSSSSSSSSSSSANGSATQGEVSSVEDWNVGVWQNPSSALNVTYAPFNPYATPTAAPVEETVAPEPTATFVIGTMIPITYDEETKETQTGSSWVGLVLGGIVLAGGAGGLYAYALTQNKKRKAAARAAAARQRSQQQNGVQNPYARRAAAAPPAAAGQQSKEQSPYQRPNPYARPQQTGQQNPYTPPTQNPYTQPTAGRAQNPYAQRTAPNNTAQPPTPAQPQAPQNPYARPQQPAAPYPQATPDTAAGSQAQPKEPSAPAEPPRTGRRSDRYKNQDDDNA